VGEELLRLEKAARDAIGDEIEPGRRRGGLPTS
jgi:hypothetical protein